MPARDASFAVRLHIASGVPWIRGFPVFSEAVACNQAVLGKLEGTRVPVGQPSKYTEIYSTTITFTVKLPYKGLCQVFASIVYLTVMYADSHGRNHANLHTNEIHNS